MKPVVSVIMSTKDQAGLLADSIESVLAQSFKDWELIIVNDGSSDNTEAVVKSFQEKDSRIIYLDNGKNLGVPKSFNKAMAVARGEFIARIDSDDAWIGKDKLKKQVEFFKNHPDYAAVGGGMVVVNLKKEELYRYLKPEQDREIRQSALITNPIANSASVCRKSTVIKVGLCDENLEFNEDWDFWLKIGLLGKLYNFPEYFSYYTMTGRNKSMVYLRQHTASALKTIWKYRKNYPNFTKGFLVNFTQFIYGHLPFTARKILNMPLSKLKKFVAGSLVYKK